MPLARRLVLPFFLFLLLLLLCLLLLHLTKTWSLQRFWTGRAEGGSNGVCTGSVSGKPHRPISDLVPVFRNLWGSTRQSRPSPTVLTHQTCRRGHTEGNAEYDGTNIDGLAEVDDFRYMFEWPLLCSPGAPFTSPKLLSLVGLIMDRRLGDQQSPKRKQGRGPSFSYSETFSSYARNFSMHLPSLVLQSSLRTLSTQSRHGTRTRRHYGTKKSSRVDSESKAAWMLCHAVTLWRREAKGRGGGASLSCSTWRSFRSSASAAAAASNSTLPASRAKYNSHSALN